MKRGAWGGGYSPWRHKELDTTEQHDTFTKHIPVCGTLSFVFETEMCLWESTFKRPHYASFVMFYQYFTGPCLLIKDK